VRHVADAVKSPREKSFDITKPGDPRPTATDAWPDGDPKSDPDVVPNGLVYYPPTGFTSDVEPH
jgi:hypothetical protein